MVHLIDTHCHLYSVKFNEDRAQAIERALKAGVQQILLPNIDLDSIPGLHQLMCDFPNQCFGMMGLHPCDVKEDYSSVLTQMFDLFDREKYYAVGEMGMDLYWDKTTEEIQKQAFLLQAEFALAHNLPLAIHTRNATQQTIQLLKQFKGKGLRGVFHCFSESLELAHEILKLEGFYLGIGGVLTFKNAGLAEVLQHIDVSHLILETDSPYLPPVPHRGTRNEPAYTLLVAQKLAEVKSLSLQHIAAATTQNAIDLFQLPIAYNP